MPTQRVIRGDMRAVLAGLPERSVHLCVTSPPYFNLRDYKLPPSVWGGDDPDCEHEWGKEPPARTVQPQRDASGGLGGGRILGTRGDQGWTAGASGRLPTGAFCRRCHAWRGCLGAEPSVALFVAHLVECFRSVWRVLRDDGTCWVVLGDSYANDAKWGGRTGGKHVEGLHGAGEEGFRQKRTTGLKPKDLCLVPERFRIAAQDDGWTVRSVIRWCKRSAMPESVTDRPTSAVEDIVVLAKSSRYFWDQEAVRRPYAMATLGDARQQGRNVEAEPRARNRGGRSDGFPSAPAATLGNPSGANLRNFWLLSPEPLADDHFAAFPTEIPRRAILAGTSERGCCPACGAGWRRVVERTANNDGYPNGPGGHKHRENGDRNESRSPGTLSEVARWNAETLGWQASCPCAPHDPVPATVLDPFLGSGRTLIAADRLGRDGIGVELSAYHAAKARRRIYDDCPLFASVAD